MKKNVGGVDRVLRISIGAVLIIFGVWQISTTLGVVMVAVGSLSLLTGVFKRCGLYNLIGVNTCNSCKDCSSCGCCKDKNTCDDCKCCKDDKCNTCEVKKETKSEPTQETSQKE